MLQEQSISQGIDCSVMNLKDYEPEDNLPNEVRIDKLTLITRCHVYSHTCKNKNLFLTQVTSSWSIWMRSYAGKSVVSVNMVLHEKGP